MAEAKGDLYLIIHGHFYQPPREDPWTGRIGLQPSADPFHDWNERINAECYAANVDARTLDDDGRIVDITNNYRHISFNFGPTLLSWIERHDRPTYESILEADRESVADNSGHGNAIAQVYNHVIMPLATERDQYTQVLWGLYDFEQRFGRPAEGMWLPETAVSAQTLDVLTDCGVRFVVLSPTQAEAVDPPDGDTWLDVSQNGIDTSQAYSIETRRGEITAFFYDLDISRAVGFEHLLIDAKNLRHRILASRRQDRDVQMVNFATDGESYGHHEAFGNMCLAKLVHDNRRDGDFTITNYGRFLERHPPTRHVRLKAGKNGLGTAWSCAHGVGRWMEDCGCKTGGDAGWSQRWRGPLRKALDYLRDEIAAVAERKADGLLPDLWAARDEYIRVLFDASQEDKGAFVAEQTEGEPSTDQRHTVLRLLEAQKYALYMYTSCAWFFCEVSGPETVQCLHYAAHALRLMADWMPADVEERFMGILEDAPSNIPQYGNARRVYEELVLARLIDGPKTVNEHVLERFLTGGDSSERCSTYDLDFTDQGEFKKNGGSVFRGTARLCLRSTREEETYLFYVLRRSLLDIVCYVKRFEDPKLGHYLNEVVEETPLAELEGRLADWFPRSYSLRDLRLGNRERLVREIYADSFRALHDVQSDRLTEHLELVEFFARMRVAIPDVERASLESSLNDEIVYQLRRLGKGGEEGFDFDRVCRLLEAAKQTGLAVNTKLASSLFSAKIREEYDTFVRERTPETYAELTALLSFTRRTELDYDCRLVENEAFAVLFGEVHDVIERLPGGADDAEIAFAGRMIELGQALQIDVDEIDETFEKRTGGRQRRLPSEVRRTRRPSYLPQER